MQVFGFYYEKRTPIIMRKIKKFAHIPLIRITANTLLPINTFRLLISLLFFLPINIPYIIS